MKISHLLLIFLAALIWRAVPSHGVNQGQALKRLMRAKRSSERSVRINTDGWTTPSYSSVQSLLQSQQGSQETDRIDALPGQPPRVSFAQYSGYVTVDSSGGTALFYYFAEATRRPSTKPLVLWLNGGPGCSSFGVGALTEVGPFRANSDGRTLHRNPHSWNKAANLLFLESPAGVGFSYSNTSSEYETTGDKRAAEQSYIFLVNWFERFSQYKSRPFYIIGESYAGHYIPQLAHTIIQHKPSFINLKGIMIGNGIMHTPTDSIGNYDYLWSHALLSDQTHQAIPKYCNFSFEAVQTQECTDLENKVYAESGNIDAYDIYYPLCTTDTSLSEQPNGYGGSTIGGYDPCMDDYATAYLNRPEVQKALHANVTHVSYPWQECSDPLFNFWTDSPWSVLPIYQKLIKTGLRILIFSGDVDSVVSATSTRYSINVLKLPIQTPWYPWLNKANEVGGYTVIYKGLTFATVRGAGHEVPRYQPSRGLTLLRHFLSGRPLPAEKN